MVGMSTIGCFSLDNEGHGRSDGLHAYIPSFENLIRDQSTHYAKVSIIIMSITRLWS
jgi:hypothetical protein